MTAVQEYRRHNRVASSEVPVGLYEDGRRISEVSMNDLSVGGMGVTISDRLEEGQVLNYSVILPGGEVKGRGVVRWVQPYSLGYRSGIEFEEVGFWDKRRIGRYIGAGFNLQIPASIKAFFDNLLFIGTSTVVALVIIDAIGLTVTDVTELVIFYIWP